uniref:proline--tRNA ligase n=1 Tax=Neobodo designis TaxID=312471 RepID=A0A7S1M0C4_NEODS|mmetsp:Transcript_31700/g.98036  ORF Transcript_31700/g.98036 Transcript_31700/m.98036 type:complete len:721 (+) Transcript_31700:65-2227(+)
MENKGDAACMAHLATLGVTAQPVSHATVTTVDAQSKALLELGATAETRAIAKNMFLKGKKGELVLVVALADTTTDMKLVCKAVGAASGSLRFASEETLNATLGVVQGCVTPLALINDAAKAVKVVLDQRLLDFPGEVGVHPCRNDQTLFLPVPQLTQYVASLGYTAVPLDFAAAAAAAAAAPAPAAAGEKPKKAPKEQPKKKGAEKPGQTKLGVGVGKLEDFPEWYSQVITKGEMVEYYDVSGCYILRPWAFAIWENIQAFFDREIKLLGVENCSFPMFVSKGALEREKDHVEGFAPEVAWVTKAGKDDLAEPVALRPTSETVMYPSFAKWIRSHRDLPLKINQWCNVIRWEFSHPTPFIRTREFLWQEGHSAFATRDEAVLEVRDILDLYRRVYEEMLAVPCVPGVKTDKERFAGADFTTSVETYIDAVGRGCQGATSHHLGQNFSKMFGIEYEDPDKGDGSKTHPYQNSWGLSTRTIGVMVMVHGDDKGLVLPPRVAQVQAVIVLVGITVNTSAEERKGLVDAATALERQLRKAGVRAKADTRDNYSPGWKFNHWEVKGVPLRIELGPNELASKTLAGVVRHDGSKCAIALGDDTGALVQAKLDEIHNGMLAKATAVRDERQKTCTKWAEFVPHLNQKHTLLAPWCGSMACEDAIKKDSAEESKALTEGAREDERAPSMGAKSLNIPDRQPELPAGTCCVRKGCPAPAVKWVLWGRSY